MTLLRARVIKAAFPSDEIRTARLDAALARRMPCATLAAREEAASILAEARARADGMLDRARADVAQIRADAARIARDEEIARVAAELLVHRIDDEQRVEREIDRTVDIAVLLAERLVGEALAIDPLRIVALATEALRETRGARRIRVEANSEDVPILAEALAALGDGIASVEASTELSRGSLVMHTEIGRVDARLEPQLRRLTDALRDTLRTAEANRSSERGARSRE